MVVDLILGDRWPWAVPTGLCSISVTSLCSDHRYPPPGISLSPEEHVEIGTNVTIRCWNNISGVAFFLHKDGHSAPIQRQKLSAGSTATFTLFGVTPADSGTYRCSYRIRGCWTSGKSDPVELVVTGEVPRPSLSLHPSQGVSLGDNVTLRCHLPRMAAWVQLWLNGTLRFNKEKDKEQDTAEFSFAVTNLEDAGTYQCRYQVSEPLRTSKKSDPVELVISPSPGNMWEWGLISPHSAGMGVVVAHSSCIEMNVRPISFARIPLVGHSHLHPLRGGLWPLLAPACNPTTPQTTNLCPHPP
uniref:Ig-like domain-containing protein n=1 Tax=Gallus gallus TaxID=9031 RepID=A0A8V0XR74_CHICK